MMQDLNAKIKIGTCGWSFEAWRGPFYPPHRAREHWLADYARCFSAVEVDSTFYHTPSRHAIAHWMGQTNDDFCFTCKLPRAITHEARLRACEAKLDFFLESIEPLRSRLGCVLVKLPASFGVGADETALRHFVKRLPRTFRFAIEFRHGDWHLPRIIHLLEAHQVGWVWNDNSPLNRQHGAPFEFFPQTSDFLYVRLLGDMAHAPAPDGHFCPRDASLEGWGIKIRKHLAECARVFLFAGNGFEGFAPLTCRRVARHLGIPIDLPGLEGPEARAASEAGQLKLL
jgi:uncharacterized protein YecE (DUF72 family)